MGNQQLKTDKVPYLDKNGIVTGTIGFVVDIIKVKKQEEIMKTERDNLIRIFESMEDGVYICDKEYNIIYVNPTLKKIFGEDTSGKCYKYFGGRETKCPWCKTQKVFNGERVRWEWYCEKNNKTYDLVDTPIFDESGGIQKLEIFRDITDMKKIEEKLKESEIRFRTIFNTSPVGICLIDDNNKFFQVNNAFLKMIEMDNNEIIGKNYDKIFNKPLYPQTSNPNNNNEDTIINKSGNKINILISTSVLEYINGEKKKFTLLTVRDITNEKKTNLILMETKEILKKKILEMSEASNEIEQDSIFKELIEIETQNMKSMEKINGNNSSTVY